MTYISQTFETKTSRQLNVLKIIGRNLCKLGKLNIYYSFIFSNFDLCHLTWHFCGEVNTKTIEKIQERALRFIYNDYSSNYEMLLSKSKLLYLKLRRLRTIALEAFKILNKQTPAYLHDLLTCKNNTNTVEIPQVRTSRHGASSFRFTAAKLWNSLPQEFRNSTSFNHFTSQISTWSGGACSCSFCSYS